jgi:uncharacterized protein (DUF1697 family)
MNSNRYVALLRGINVGGKNIIAMKDLKICFEDMGFSDVSTYIQSGNVLFSDSGRKSVSELEDIIEKALSKRFAYHSRAVVLSDRELAQVVRGAPAWCGKEPLRFRYDVIFLKSPLTAVHAMQEIKTKEGVDRATAGARVLYFSRRIERASSSHLTRIVQSPIYQSITIRNWNTTTKLLARIEE